MNRRNKGATAQTWLSRLHLALLRWYRRRGRRLPWRNTSDPYRILISEVMLQQTQVSRVLMKYQEFLKQFPTLRTLGAARASEVIRTWHSMGYNRRALRLRKLAEIVAQDYGGVLPRSVDKLMTLPGIGPYTAHAIACFAFKRGRIIQVLRKLKSGETISRFALQRIVKPQPRLSGRSWFDSLVDSLAAEGLVRYHQRDALSIPE